jgi:hypothetical protein
MLPNDDLMLMQLAKMDNVPPGVLEELQKRHPRSQVICVGDVPPESLPADVTTILKEIEKKHARSLVEGRCLDCDKQMPNYPTTADAMDTFKPETGWTWFENNGTICAWQCPDCDVQDKEETVDLDDDDVDPEDTDLWIPAHECQTEKEKDITQ